MLATCGRKFIYAGYICIGHQSKSFTELDQALSLDAAAVTNFCKQWRQTPSVTTSVSSVSQTTSRHAGIKMNFFHS